MRFLFMACSVALLCACGGGGDNGGSAGSGGNSNPVPPPPPPPSPPSPPPPAATFSVGGAVTGLAGSGLTLRNANDNLAIIADGNFAFPGEFADGTAYDITIAAQPASPLQQCTVTNGSGLIAGSDVTGILVECVSIYQFQSSVPIDGAVEISRAVHPNLTFTADLDAATATAGSVTLVSDVTNESEFIEASVANNVLTLRPRSKLLPLTPYTIRVTTDLLSVDGAVLEDPITTTFTTREAEWQPEVALPDVPGSPFDPQLAFDRDGNALAVWSQQGAGFQTHVWSSYWSVDSNAWSSPQRVETSTSSFAGGAQVGFDDTGTAIAIWSQRDETSSGDFSVWANRFIPGSGWGTAQLIETNGGDADRPRLAVHASGNAIAAWSQFDGVTLDVLAANYSPGMGWSTPQLVEASAQPVFDVGLAMDPQGNAIVGWRQHDGAGFSSDAFVNRYQPDTGWGTPQRLSVNRVAGNDTASAPVLAMDPDGNAMAIWLNTAVAGTASVYASHFDGVTWNAPVRVDAAIDGVDFPRLAMGTNGVAIAVWRQVDSALGRRVAHANRFDPASGWGLSERINTDNSVATPFYPSVVMDESGNALAVWSQLDSSTGSHIFSACANRYTPAGGWGASERIGHEGDLIGTQEPRVAVDRRGNAFAIWDQLEIGQNRTRIQTARFE